MTAFESGFGFEKFAMPRCDRRVPAKPRKTFLICCPSLKNGMTDAHPLSPITFKVWLNKFHDRTQRRELQSSSRQRIFHIFLALPTSIFVNESEQRRATKQFSIKKIARQDSECQKWQALKFISELDLRQDTPRPSGCAGIYADFI